jgi:hypothetical protein
VRAGASSRGGPIPPASQTGGRSDGCHPARRCQINTMSVYSIRGSVPRGRPLRAGRGRHGRRRHRMCRPSRPRPTVDLGRTPSARHRPGVPAPRRSSCERTPSTTCEAWCLTLPARPPWCTRAGRGDSTAKRSPCAWTAIPERGAIAHADLADVLSVGERRAEARVELTESLDCVWANGNLMLERLEVELAMSWRRVG